MVRTPLSALLLGALLAPAPPLELSKTDGTAFDRFEASGIALFAGRLVVVDDTLNDLFVFDRDGRLRQSFLPAGFPSGRAKFEDVAVDPSSGLGFAVGSHEGYTEETLEEFSRLVEFRLTATGTGLAVEPGSVHLLPLYRSFAKEGLWRPRGMKIEGLALDPERRDLYVALREPSEPSRVYRLSIDALERLSPDEEGEAALTVALRFDAGRLEDTPFHLSALTWLPHRRALLMITSTEDESTHRFLGNRIWLGEPDEGRVRMLHDTFDAGLKAEGITVDPDADAVYICYDDDQDDTGIPSRLRTLSLRDLTASGSRGPEGPVPAARR